MVSAVVCSSACSSALRGLGPAGAPLGRADDSACCSEDASDAAREETLLFVVGCAAAVLDEAAVGCVAAGGAEAEAATVNGQGQE